MDNEALLEILTPARIFNSEHGISGLLLYKDHSFIQLLEGEPEQVEPLYSRILEDKRHFRVKMLMRESANERLFGEWSMGFQNLDSYTPTHDVQGYSQFMADTYDISELVKSPDKSLELLLYFRARS